MAEAYDVSAVIQQGVLSYLDERHAPMGDIAGAVGSILSRNGIHADQAPRVVSRMTERAVTALERAGRIRAIGRGKGKVYMIEEGEV